MTDLGGMVVGLDDSGVPLGGTLGAVHLHTIAHQYRRGGQQDLLAVLVALPRLDGLGHLGETL